MKSNILTSESFSSGSKHYYLDYKQACNNSKYISFTLSKTQHCGGFERQSILIFEEDFGLFIGSFSSLMTSVGHYGKGYESVQEMWALRKENGKRDGNGIKAMDEGDRPREKCWRGGCDDDRLRTIGYADRIWYAPSENAIDLAHRILQSVER